MKRLRNKSNISTVKDYLAGERPFLQTGYVGDKDKYIIRKVGEEWTDHLGKKWKQTESGPQTETPVMDIIRAEMNLKCNGCGMEIRWGNRQDQKMFYRTGKCFDCVIKEEHEMRLNGTYELYETKKLIKNELAYLEDVRAKLKESKEYLTNNKVITYVNSNGLVEEWKNEARVELLNTVKKDWVTCLKKITSAEKELAKVEQEIKKKIPAVVAVSPTTGSVSPS